MTFDKTCGYRERYRQNNSLNQSRPRFQRLRFARIKCLRHMRWWYAVARRLAQCGCAAGVLRCGDNKVTKLATIRGFSLISREHMESLHTGTLMRFRRELLGLHDSTAICDLTKQEIASLDDSTTIYFKSDPRWEPLYQQLKEVLNTRENWPPSRS